MSYSKSDIPKISEKFNKNIIRLLKVIESLNLNEYKSNIKVCKTALNIAINETPILLLQNSGKYIFIYKDYIINKNFDELFNVDNISNYKKVLENDYSDVVNEFNNNDMIKLMNIIKLKWNNFNEHEKNYIYKIFTNLLSEYSKYKTIN